MNESTKDAADRSDLASSSTSQNPLYRQEAFSRRGQRESIDDLLRVTAPHEWAVMIGLVVGILALVIWIAFGQIERGISSNCLVIHPGDRYMIVAERDGNVAEVLTQVGAAVEVGDPLARLNSSELDREVRRAQSKVDLLEGRSGSEESGELAVAHNDLLELVALQTAGQLVISHVAGELMSHQLSMGRTIRVGDEVAVVRRRDSGPVQAVTMVSSGDALLLQPGMDARVNVAVGTPKSETVFDAEVLSVSESAVDPPPWLTDLGLIGPTNGQLVELVFREQSHNSVADGTSCSSRIVYERGSPLSVIIP